MTPITYYSYFLNILHSKHIKYGCGWAVVVAQLVERSLPKPEVRGLNPVISKNSYTY